MFSWEFSVSAILRNLGDRVYWWRIQCLPLAEYASPIRTAGIVVWSKDVKHLSRMRAGSAPVLSIHDRCFIPYVINAAKYHDKGRDENKIIFYFLSLSTNTQVTVSRSVAYEWDKSSRSQGLQFVKACSLSHSCHAHVTSKLNRYEWEILILRGKLRVLLVRQCATFRSNWPIN